MDSSAEETRRLAVKSKTYICSICGPIRDTLKSGQIDKNSSDESLIKQEERMKSNINEKIPEKKVNYRREILISLLILLVYVCLLLIFN